MEELINQLIKVFVEQAQLQGLLKRGFYILQF